jgi:hypothetical protein
MPLSCKRERGSADQGEAAQKAEIEGLGEVVDLEGRGWSSPDRLPRAVLVFQRPADYGAFMVDRRFALLSLLACLGGAWLLYLPALQGQFVFDDIPLLVLNRCHEGLAGLAQAFDFGSGHTCSLRPVRFVSYALDHAVFGPGPFGFHATNHLLHGLVAWLAGALVARLTRQRWVGAVAGLLFLTHPIATEAVAYIAGRRDLLAALGGGWAWPMSGSALPQPKKGVNPVGCLVFRLRKLALWLARSASQPLARVP